MFINRTTIINETIKQPSPFYIIPPMYNLGMTIILIGLSIIVHELGHILAMCIYNKQFPKISFKNMEIIVDDNKGENIVIVWAGIITGIIPLLFTLRFVNGYWFVAIVIIYLFGCKYDFKKLRRFKNGK